MVIIICSVCGKECKKGVDGFRDKCDSCAGVTRDKYGYAWEKDEIELGYRYSILNEKIFYEPKDE